MPAPGRCYREGMSLIELTEVFSDAASATAWFESLIWPDVRACPHCGSTDTFENSSAGESRPYRCRDCHRHLSVRVGTALARSRVPLRKRVLAICPEMTSLEGVSSMKLHRDLKVTQKTAWFMLQRIREVLDGPAEADESDWGGKEVDKQLRAGRGVGRKDRRGRYSGSCHRTGHGQGCREDRRRDAARLRDGSHRRRLDRPCRRSPGLQGASAPP